MDDERELLTCIAGLVAEEHWLRSRLGNGVIEQTQFDLRVAEIERTMNDLWRELRRRRGESARVVQLDPAESDDLTDLAAS